MKKTLLPQASSSAVTLPFFKFFFGTYGLLIDRFREFFILGSLFAVVLSIIVLGSGLSIFCIPSIPQDRLFCSDNIYVFFVVRVMLFGVSCMFVRAWLQILISGCRQKWLSYLIPCRADFKIAGLALLCFATFFAAAASVYLLYTREPNPDWRIEMLYFTVVALGFLLPFLGIKFSGYFAFAGNNDPLPSPKIMWQKTSGSGFALLSGMIFLMLLGFSISSSLFYNFVNEENAGRFYAILGGEYLVRLFNLLIIACFTNYCYLQRKYLFERNEDEKSGN